MTSDDVFDMCCPRLSLLSNLAPERAKEAHSPFSKASTHPNPPTKAMNDASPATQHIPRLHPPSVLDSCAQSSGPSSAGFVFIAFRKLFLLTLIHRRCLVPPLRSPTECSLPPSP